MDLVQNANEGYWWNFGRFRVFFESFANVQGDTKKTVITKNRITSKMLFRLTQNFSYIWSRLCSRHLQSFKSVLQKLFVSLALKNVLQLSSPALQAHLDPVGKVLDDPPAFLPRDRSYCCFDCCLQVRDSVGLLPNTLSLRYPHIQTSGGFKSGECGDHCGSHRDPTWGSSAPGRVEKFHPPHSVA